MDSFSLADDLSERWYAATELCDLIEQADEFLTRRHLVLFRASCCATLLPFVDDPLCDEAVAALERLALNWNYHEHNEHVLRLLNEVPLRLRIEIAEAQERFDSWVSMDLPEALDIRRRLDNLRPQALKDAPIEPTEEYLQLQSDFDQLIAGHAVINSTHRSIKANSQRIKVIECIHQSSVSIGAWGLTDEIKATQRREPEIAHVRVGAIYPHQEFGYSMRHYQRSHCNTFREIVPGPEFDTERVERWRQPEVLAIACELDASRDFLQMDRLADTLQDAGCDDPALFLHCARTDPTIRGSWLVDLLLGRR